MIHNIAKAIFFIVIFSACSNINLKLPWNSSSDLVSRISAPIKDSSYLRLSNRVITSQNEYNAFISRTAVKIKEANINFGKSNLIVYRHMENSGSTLIKPKPPVVSDTNATITIERIVAKVGTADMVFYGLFYKVDKKIKRITFRSSQGDIVILNAKDSSIPRECIAWFDGCNHCMRGTNGRVMCTKKYCKNKGDFRCVKWE